MKYFLLIVAFLGWFYDSGGNQAHANTDNLVRSNAMKSSGMMESCKAECKTKHGDEKCKQSVEKQVVRWALGCGYGSVKKFNYAGLRSCEDEQSELKLLCPTLLDEKLANVDSIPRSKQ